MENCKSLGCGTSRQTIGQEMLDKLASINTALMNLSSGYHAKLDKIAAPEQPALAKQANEVNPIEPMPEYFGLMMESIRGMAHTITLMNALLDRLEI